VGKNRNPVAFAHAEMVQGTSKSFHRRYRLGEGQAGIAINPAQRGFAGLPDCAVE
jgi:hypothetical protein